ncbi:hypothetical protein [Prevotella melaninogenica]
MVRLYVCLDAGVSTSSSRRKSIRAVYLYPLLVAIVLNGYCAYRFTLEKWTFLAILAFVVAMVLDFFPIVAYFVIMEIYMA